MFIIGWSSCPSQSSFMFVGQVSRVHLKVAIFHFLSLKLGKYPLKIFGGLSRSGECTPMVAFEKKTKRHLLKMWRAIREMAVSSACQLKSFLLFIYLFASVFFIFSIQNKKNCRKIWITWEGTGQDWKVKHSWITDVQRFWTLGPGSKGLPSTETQAPMTKKLF